MDITPSNVDDPRWERRRAPPDLSPLTLLTTLRALAPVTGYRLAYSGGLDSTVLLHLLIELRQALGPQAPIRAVHIDHGLSAHSQAWAAHCVAQCAQWCIELQVLKVQAQARAGESPEAAARTARYAALAGVLAPGEALLTAHHQDDQAETVLLALLRGAGVQGLDAMPVIQPLGSGLLLRPLLGYNRATLAAYAHAQHLQWVEDDSNTNHRFDRNYLRHTVMPLLTARWPSAARALARSARHCGQTVELLREWSATDLTAVIGERADMLSIPALQALSPARQTHVLRAWIAALGLPLPDTIHLQRIQTEVLRARPDRNPLVRWPGAEVRRYRQALYLMAPLAAAEGVSQPLLWDGRQPLALADGRLLRAQLTRGAGVRISLLANGPLTVRFRQGGEQAHPAGRTHAHDLKRLLQDYGIPPWERARIPLIYQGSQLLTAVGLFVAHNAQVNAQEMGWVWTIEIQRDKKWDAAGG